MLHRRHRPLVATPVHQPVPVEVVLAMMQQAAADLQEAVAEVRRNQTQRRNRK